MPGHPSPAVAHNRAIVGALRRYRDPDDPKVVEARRNLAAERLHEYVESVIRDWPPLSDDQRARIVGLLQAGPA